ncbi:MAG TPA: ribose 5-phosphate isomerase B [Rhodospirillaceae bacterium]|nr:ribose 5-phosphate isomerase B [Alphaproteobacteria bacterium]OUT42174.1 MAG: ribose 5-phosphate isomerase B [Micavibrio sp. TMED2]HCI47876.1 ribose 5-phosphate isomerase B [Rhodospirillaceae bacterium]MAS46210.1 ribose 5-phosphate isomerase B [Alphaproteobacteria bacterium]MAX95607.1 ribose 5-phosphate isomerase B [Alphaproteobacteria bacterium]|tara:strand:+ start:4365 stop:4790 length:426 start_codon:yes stop_codon:yes gene_type:complete
MKVAVASDHAGYDLKQEVVAYLKELGHEALDLGTHEGASVDYPDYGKKLGEAVADGTAERGIAICGSGIGISIAANRIAGVRAALCGDGLMARLSRQHNDANVLALGARLIGVETAKDCVVTFLNTAYEGGRHDRRVAKLG